MFNWRGKDKEASGRAVMPEIGQSTDIGELMARDLVILFKHSHACPVSWAAHSQMSRFAAQHPDVPIFLIPVIKERAFSREVARRIDVEHESPQVIILRHGAVDAVASHGEITETALSRMLLHK